MKGRTEETAAPAAGPVTPFEALTAMPPPGRLDQLVFGKLRAAGIEPAATCSDAVFLRRAYLDLIGTLPTPVEARAFLTDTDPARRPALVDTLLGRGEYADYWSMKWSDVLRVKAEFPINLWPNAVQTYRHWLTIALRDDMPYDRFARALLTASGSNFRVPPVNFYRAVQSRKPEGLAEAVALTFLGERVDHWPKARLAGMAAFFSEVAFKKTGEWKEEIVLLDPEKAASGSTLVGRFPDGKIARIPTGTDPRVVFATGCSGRAIRRSRAAS